MKELSNDSQVEEKLILEKESILHHLNMWDLNTPFLKELSKKSITSVRGVTQKKRGRPRKVVLPVSARPRRNTPGLPTDGSLFFSGGSDDSSEDPMIRKRTKEIEEKDKNFTIKINQAKKSKNQESEKERNDEENEKSKENSDESSKEKSSSEEEKTEKPKKTKTKKKKSTSFKKANSQQNSQENSKEKSDKKKKKKKSKDETNNEDGSY